MASSSASIPSDFTETILMGPAKTTFETFPDQCSYFLNTYWENWRCSRSYMIPPAFSYKNPDVSDEACGGVSPETRLNIDRSSDDAERMVYDAIFQLTQDEVRAPFIAVHDLGVEKMKHHLVSLFPEFKFLHLQNILCNYFDKKIQKPEISTSRQQSLETDFRNYLQQIFEENPSKYLQRLDELGNQLSEENKAKKRNQMEKQKFEELVGSDWTELKRIANQYFRQYDFVLIGPKIGIVVIEVKSSKHTRSKDFQNKYLPSRYEHGLGQLKSADDALLPLLADCIGIELPKELRVRKILFSPNLKKKRFEEWRNNLSEDCAENTKIKIGDVMLWFEEDTLNSTEDDKKPPLYTTLRNLLESSGFSLPTILFESLVPVVAGLKSASVLRSALSSIELDKLNFSDVDVTLAVSEMIDKQDPLRGQEKSTHSFLQESPEPSTVIFLTPDQQNALNGPCRQFIVGPAGTGKTIILQTKALQLLKEGRSVLVFAARNFEHKYKELFEKHRCKNYQVLSWPTEFVNRQVDGFVDFERYVQKILSANVEFCISTVVLALQKFIQGEIVKENNMFSWLTKVDNVFIDDACDRDRSQSAIDSKSIFACFGLMTFAEMYHSETENSKKVLWIAMDPSVAVGFKINSYEIGFIMDIMLEFFWGTAKPKSANTAKTATLRRVMRCSENIFHVAYESMRWRTDLLPFCGHKIPGPSCIFVRERCQTKEEAIMVLWDEIDKYIRFFLKQNFDFTQMAIIVSGGRSTSVIRRELSGRLSTEYPIHLKAKSSNSHSGVSFITVNEKLFGMYDYDYVSSSEWPVVILARCAEVLVNDYDPYYYDYPTYRAATRATGKLICINVRYNKSE